MASPSRLDPKRLLVIVVLCLCCSPATSQKTKTTWLKRIIQDLVNTYNKFAEMEGDPRTMNCQEFTEYLKVDIPGYLEGKDPDMVEKMLVALDKDKDGELNYGEFFSFQAQYMVARYKADNQLQA
ncbi:protein S100-G-like [Rhinoderma darwinii]|uniref:protein S100-G-like n=1 Tax=Rhinoderma darwinii TaxID=43563 RepID=UPI003F679EE4